MTAKKKQTNITQKLSKKIIADIKKKLLSRKRQILDDLNNFTKKDKHSKNKHRTKFPEYGDKTDENAQEISEYSTNLATEKILENTLRDINNALDRMKKGTYGICKYCKNTIGVKRMLARPIASACIDCKTKLQNS